MVLKYINSVCPLCDYTFMVYLSNVHECPPEMDYTPGRASLAAHFQLHHKT